LVGTKDALDALSFWLAPVVSPASAVLLDTWGISLILQASLMRLPKTLAWDALRIHPSHDRLAARKTLENLVSDVPKGSTVIFLESLHISGRMWNLMQLVFEELGRPDLKLQAHAMFNFKNSDAAVRPLCELHETIEKYESQETCRLCEKGSPRFRIDPKVYYLREVSQTPVFFEKGHYATGREFVDRYKDVPAAFRLHRQDPNDGRHHAFDIDVLTLLENNTFLDRLDKHLDAIESPDVIVVPNHEPGTRLGEIASSKFKRPLVIHDNLRPDSKLKDADSRLLKDSRHILILDDVLNSGSRLHKYNKTLRESGYAPFDRVSYVVAVARPQSEAEWKHHRASLTMHHDWAATLTGVEKIYLPRWKRNECPWCKEEILLASISSPFPSAPKWISDRTQKLADTEYGLNRDIFLSVPPAETSSLGASSDFGPQGLSPVATTFCVVSALQELRNGPAPDKQLRPNFPNFNVFNIKKCLELYDEALLRAIFLRVVVASEWGELARRELGKFLPPELLKPDHAQVRGETLVCMYRNGLRIDPAEFHSAFSPHLTADEETILVKTLGISQTAPNFQ